MIYIWCLLGFLQLAPVVLGLYDMHLLDSVRFCISKSTIRH